MFRPDFGTKIDIGKVKTISEGTQTATTRKEAGDSWQVAQHLAEVSRASIIDTRTVKIQRPDTASSERVNSFARAWGVENFELNTAPPRLAFLEIGTNQVLGTVFPLLLNEKSNDIGLLFAPSAITRAWLDEFRTHSALYSQLSPEHVVKFLSIYRGITHPEVLSQYRANCDKAASAPQAIQTLSHLDPVLVSIMTTKGINASLFSTYLASIGADASSSLNDVSHTHALQPQNAHQAANIQLASGLSGGLETGLFLFAPGNEALASRVYPNYTVIPDHQGLHILMHSVHKRSSIVPIDQAVIEQLPYALRAVAMGLHVPPTRVRQTFDEIATHPNDPISAITQRISASR
jgi:hypothetical protein